MRFIYSRIDRWPPLAWLAAGSHGSDELKVFHGPLVETRPHWFCEAVWDGDFASGDLDCTDILFGSGARLRDGAAVFVPAGSTVDRLHSLTHAGSFWISNSLPCLMTALSAKVDPAYPDYIGDFRSIIDGIDRYKRDLATSAGPVRLTYFNNLCWNGERLTEITKPFPKRDFSTFAKYRSFLASSLSRITLNMSAAERRHPYRLLGTISSGYDSPAVTVLGLECGLDEVIGFDKRWTGEPDSGEEVARILGVRMVPIIADAWHQDALAPIPFLAVDANGGDVTYSLVGDRLAGRVLLTGYESGRVWKKRATEPNDHNITRPDQSGLSLSEYRLWAGFIHLPIPYMGIRQVADINAIGRSAEMAPWDVGGRYNKPIPRRIAEEAGVPRNKFALRKVGVSVRLSSPEIFRSARFRDDYFNWLHEHRWAWMRRGRLPPQTLSALAAPLQGSAQALSSAIRGMGRWLGMQSRPGRSLRTFATRDYAYRFLFPWALHKAQQRYQPPIASGRTG